MPTKRFQIDTTQWVQVTAGAGVVDAVEGCDHVRVYVGTAAPALETEDHHTLRWGGKDTFPYGQSENIYIRASKDKSYAIVTSETVQ